MNTYKIEKFRRALRLLIQETEQMGRDARQIHGEYRKGDSSAESTICSLERLYNTSGPKIQAQLEGVQSLLKDIGGVESLSDGVVT